MRNTKKNRANKAWSKVFLIAGMLCGLGGDVFSCLICIFIYSKLSNKY